MPSDDDFYASTSTSRLPPPMTRPARQRTRTSKASNLDSDDLYEEPGGGGGGGGHAPKIKLKMGGGGHGGGHGPEIDPTAIGWDRELDSDPDEPLAVEEHFVLRVPPTLAPYLRDMVERREMTPDVWFKFKDSRRAVFHAGDKLYGAKLVDLPTLSESQKMTGTGGQSVKVCDISQMLLVEDEVRDEAQVTADRAFNIEDFIYPHGLLPPLKHVRKRRFRKRVNRRTIETVETAVEQLLEQDARAETVEYELVDNYASDDEYGGVNGGEAGSQAMRDNDLDSLGAPTPMRDAGDDDEGFNEGPAQAEEEEEDEGYDSDLAAEINKGLEALNASADEDSGGSDGGLFGDDDSSDDDEEEDAADDPETLDIKRRIKNFAEEMANLQRNITAKEAEVAKQQNPLFKKRFEDMLRKFASDLETKKAQHAAAERELARKKQADASQDAAESAATVAAATAAAATAEGAGTVAPVPDGPVVLLDSPAIDRMDES